MRRNGWILVVLAALALWAWQRQGLPAFAGGAQPPASQSRAGTGGDAASDGDARRWPAFLPREARDTLALIESGGPFPYRQDGATFQNREHRLPRHEPGYYREYTVETPGSPDRGARRIIAGGDPPAEFFYTDDHYGSFRRFTAADGEGGGDDGGDADGSVGGGR